VLSERVAEIMLCTLDHLWTIWVYLGSHCVHIGRHWAVLGAAGHFSCIQAPLGDDLGDLGALAGPS
jgi:hypothetical protein